jgi:MFS family permease
LIKKLPKIARYTFFYHFRALFFDGIFNGVWLLNDIVARKHFGASPLLITLLVMAPSAALILSLPLGPIMAKRNKRWFFIGAGFARLSLLFVPFFDSPIVFVLLAMIASCSWPIFYIAQNAILKKNYPDYVRGRIFGFVYSFSGFMAIIVALSLGKFYDHFKNLILFSYIFAGICGFLSNYFMSKIRERMGKEEEQILTKPLEILKKRKDYLIFQISFFFYGTAYMMMLPLLPIFLVDHLKVNYTQASFLNGLFFQGMMVFASFIVGRMMDFVNPLKFVKLGFFCLFLYPIFLSFAKGVSYAYFVYGFYGVSMAIVNVAWYLAPIVFVRAKGEAASFMALHVALAGVRAFIAFPLGTSLYYLTHSFMIPFYVASLLFFLGFLIAPLKTEN